jgi:uncharacterized protein (TIGR04222 family)
MNPFDLRGPAFLAFFLCASGAGLFLLYLVSRGLFTDSPPPSGPARRHLRDPYLLAYLRGGVREALQIVAFSLNKRRLLSSAGSSLLATKSTEALRAIRNPLELALLSHYSTLTSVMDLLQNPRLKIAAENYAEPLREAGLIADDVEFNRRFPAFLVITGSLLALAVIKIYVAFQRGHTNVIFLVILTLLASGAAVAIWRRLRTRAGDRALWDQQTLFARLRGRVKRLAGDDAADEAVLVAAAFGLSALPSGAYPFASRLKRQLASSSSNSSSSSTCGSSCGSSCGGGGCGGGCGGCGS